MGTLLLVLGTPASESSRAGSGYRYSSAGKGNGSPAGIGQPCWHLEVGLYLVVLLVMGSPAGIREFCCS